MGSVARIRLPKGTGIYQEETGSSNFVFKKKNFEREEMVKFTTEQIRSEFH